MCKAEETCINTECILIINVIFFPLFFLLFWFPFRKFFSVEGEIAPIIHAIITINIIKGNKVSLNPKKTGQNERDWGVGLLGSPPPSLNSDCSEIKS